MDTDVLPEREQLRTTERYLAALAIAAGGRLVSIELPPPGGTRLTFVVEDAPASLERLLALDQITVQGKRALEALQTIDHAIYSHKKQRGRQ